MHTGHTRSRAQRDTHTHTHTLFLIWPIKTRVCEKRKKVVGGADTRTDAHTHTQTHPADPVPG